MNHAANKSKGNMPEQCVEPFYTYLPDGVSFSSQKAAALRTVYFPLCGIDAERIKSSITPFLSGDIKIDKDRYLTKPVSVEDLRQDLRNFFCYVQEKGVVSLTDGKGRDDFIEAGMLWHRVVREHAAAGLKIEALSFVPISGDNVELMHVTVTNIGKENLTPTFSLPVFGRALINKHDHEHVTSLLHRIEQLSAGVCVEPTMVFDEHGHQPSERVYYVLGADAQGEAPLGTFPTVESFYGESGTVSAPEAVMANAAPAALSQTTIQGKEAVGALRFKDVTLEPGEGKEYLIVMGVGDDREDMLNAFNRFNSTEKFEEALKQNKAFWTQKSQAIEFSTGDEGFDAWMRWVTIQPVLRRIYGCSFLPDHDYGKGGRGWRDIWQDLLSLILIEPENIRKDLINNFSGVRMDGSNATIIGAAPGEFIADRNAIARVWMDHGVWPFTTLLLYINQTGDYDILLEENTYFRDRQLSRAFEQDGTWKPEDGNRLTDQNERVYKGTLVEHMLVQHLVQFFNVGEHNIIRLEGADWNDGLDMAKERGESVAFMSFYGGNLLALADLLERLSSERGIKKLSLAAEVGALLDSLTGIAVDYDNPQAKKRFLFETYFPSVQPHVSGGQVTVFIEGVVEDLRRKGQWIFKHLRTNEMVSVQNGNRKDRWFNGYYDNKGIRVEGKKDDRVRMTLVGQVFPVMSGAAKDEEVQSIIQAVGRYLRDETLGGIRLNTDFGIPHYLDLGRAFGFAYGTKENGAFFTHMTVMYAYALYKRGFVREGHEVLRSIYRMCLDTDKSKIYPGVPEYFDAEGRGRYHYLTGAASWLILTQLTQVFGVRGESGDLLLDPKLIKEEFNQETGLAVAKCSFAGKKISVTYENPDGLDFGEYRIKEVLINGESVAFEKGESNTARIQRNLIEGILSECKLTVILGTP